MTVAKVLDRVEAWLLLWVLQALGVLVPAPPEVPPAAALPLPGGDRAGALPPPPSNAPCPAQGPQLLFERTGHSRLEQELAHAHWVLGFWSGKSWPGGFVLDARVRH